MGLEVKIDDAITEILQEVYHRIRDDNPEFDTKVKQITELSEIEHIIQTKLTDEEYERHSEMVALQQEVDNRMQTEAYIQGAKDCVAMLRKVGVIL